MAEFIYKDYSCKLQFGDHKYNLPLNEQTAELLENTFSDKILPPKFETISDIDTFYNNVMDGIDTVFGEGEAEKIMSRFAHAGTMELLSVVNFIMDEWNKQYTAAVAEMKTTAQIPNRETRRATNKGGRR